MSTVVRGLYQSLHIEHIMHGSPENDPAKRSKTTFREYISEIMGRKPKKRAEGRMIIILPKTYLTNQATKTSHGQIQQYPSNKENTEMDDCLDT